MAIRNVFVTVGTTKFDKLITSVISDELLEVLSKKGCTRLTLQVGQGNLVPDTVKRGIQIESFSLKPSITEDIANADLVISHAGAGSCLAVLNANKPLIVVVNEDLMNNHQEELANKFAEEKYVFKSNCNTLICVLEDFNVKKLKSYEPGNPNVYAQHIDKLMGFSC